MRSEETKKRTRLTIRRVDEVAASSEERSLRSLEGSTGVAYSSSCEEKGRRRVNYGARSKSQRQRKEEREKAHEARTASEIEQLPSAGQKREPDDWSSERENTHEAVVGKEEQSLLLRQQSQDPTR